MSNELSGNASSMAEFLAGRRAHVDPAVAGVPVHGHRRVAGLRREEVAVRAGVSVDYYTRLEQGREMHPSRQVLDALAAALMLEDDAREHLHRLGGALPVSRHPASSMGVSPELLRLLSELRDSPALVLDQTLDVLARNRLCDRLHDGFAIIDNSARMVFLDPAGRTFYGSARPNRRLQAYDSPPVNCPTTRPCSSSYANFLRRVLISAISGDARSSAQKRTRSSTSSIRRPVR
jgi:transcriptional regulator with XRE-family HTH domain